MSKLKKSGARKWVLGLLAGVSSIAVFASCAPAFAAADAETKAEIRALKEQLKRLEQRLESQAQSQRQTERKVERVEHATVEAAPPGGPVQPREQGWRRPGRPRSTIRPSPSLPAASSNSPRCIAIAS